MIHLPFAEKVLYNSDRTAKIICDVGSNSIRLQQIFMTIAHLHANTAELIERWMKSEKESPFVTIKLSKYKTKEQMSEIYRRLELTKEPNIEKVEYTSKFTRDHLTVVDDVGDDDPKEKPDFFKKREGTEVKKHKIKSRRDANVGRFRMNTAEIARTEFSIKYEKPHIIGYTSLNPFDVLEVEQELFSENEQQLHTVIKKQANEIESLNNKLGKANGEILNLKHENRVLRDRKEFGDSVPMIKKMLDQVSTMASEAKVNIQLKREKLDQLKRVAFERSQKKLSEKKETDFVSFTQKLNWEREIKEPVVKEKLRLTEGEVIALLDSGYSANDITLLLETKLKPTQKAPLSIITQGEIIEKTKQRMETHHERDSSGETIINDGDESGKNDGSNYGDDFDFDD